MRCGRKFTVIAVTVVLAAATASTAQAANTSGMELSAGSNDAFSAEAASPEPALPPGVTAAKVVEDVTSSDTAPVVSVASGAVEVVKQQPESLKEGSDALSVATAVQVQTGYPNSTVMGNLTAAKTTTPGWTTAWPCDQSRPATSVNNYEAGVAATPNFVAVKTDTTGHACFYTLGSAEIFWDQYGPTPGVGAHTATRTLDTRKTGTKPGTDSVTRVETGQPGKTILANVTVTQADAPGHTRVWPCEEAMPVSSTNNFVAGKTSPNFVAVKADSTGAVCIYTNAPAHLLWDQYAEVSPSYLPSHSPVRIIDTRKGNSPPLEAGSTIRIATGRPETVVMGNLTAVNPSHYGHTTVWNCNGPVPTSSVNNYVPTVNSPNFAAVKTNSTGEFCIYTSGMTHLIWDQTIETTNLQIGNPSRLIDTRTWMSPNVDSSLVRGLQPADYNTGDDSDHWSLLLPKIGAEYVRWDPCQASIPVYLNKGSATAADIAALKAAIISLADKTGLPLTYAGETNVIPTKSNQYGYVSDSAPRIVLAYATPGTETDIIPAGAAGLGGMLFYETTGKGIHGFVAIDETKSPSWSNAMKQSVLMHELGHAVGLGHYYDSRQVMNPILANSTLTWGRGDLHGLSAIGLPSGCKL